MLERIKRFLKWETSISKHEKFEQGKLVIEFNEIHYQIHYSEKYLLVAGLRIIWRCISGRIFV